MVKDKKQFSIQSFQNFVLNKRNIEQILDNTFSERVNKSPKKNKPVISQIKQSILIPKFKNDLFWCYYIITNGISAYEMIHNDFKESISIKIELVSKVRENKDLLKKYKWKKCIIEDELANCPIISLQTFFCICAIKNQNVLYIDNNKFFTLIEDLDTSKNLNIIIKKNDRFCLFIGSNEEKIVELEKCRNNLWKIENIAKPLRGISAYKLKDIQNICNKLNIDIYKEKKPKKKSILYQEIREQL